MFEKTRTACNTSGESSSYPVNVNGDDPSLVLLADDNDDNLLLISYAMELLGIEFITAQTGQDVIFLAGQHSFSLMFLDILLPDINGTVVCKWLRQNSANRELPIIAVTALARPSDRNLILEAGFTDYLLKPYMLDDLSAMTLKYLRQNSSRR